MEGKTLLVISDTHGNLPALEAVLRWAKRRAIDTAVFLGDGAADLAAASAATGFTCQWEKVRGNGDFSFISPELQPGPQAAGVLKASLQNPLPEAAVFDFCGLRLFLTHGHRYALYNGYDTLAAAARNVQADAVMFGHTHIPFYGQENGLLLINPGSVGKPRSRIGASFAVIEREDPARRQFEVRFFGIGAGRKIREIQIQ